MDIARNTHPVEGRFRHPMQRPRLPDRMKDLSVDAIEFVLVQYQTGNAQGSRNSTTDARRVDQRSDRKPQNRLRIRPRDAVSTRNRCSFNSNPYWTDQ